ncbi:MAG TPA: hypothetical protein VFU29_10375 [Chitinophagaceae bacterium]|nr:hypothetical protein [Chitinophagaceae bacterium]
MKRTLVLATIILFYTTVNATASTDSIPADPKDVSSPEAIVAAVYDVISGPAGQKRNWDRMRTLFVPDARMIPTGKRPTGESTRRTMTVEEYITNAGPFLEKDGFFETEIGKKTEQFGNIVHVFSTYGSKRTLADEKPFMRGINSFQLWYDGRRWWVITIFWQSESKDTSIPEKYITTKG